MSWTNLFKSKSSAPKPDPRVRWFGKLPTYPDYYRSATDEEWADEFNTWVLKGYELYSGRFSGDERRKARLPVSAGVIRLPKSGMTVFASILDFGGDMRNRPFPMCFYAGVPTSQWTGPTSDRVMSAADVLRRLLGFSRDVAQFLNSPGSLEAVFAHREVDFVDIEEGRADDSWLDRAKTVTLSDWFEAAREGLRAQAYERWFEHVAAWGDSVASRDDKDFEPTLRFPLASGLPLEVQAAGWFRWLESRMDLTQRAVSVVVTGDVNREVAQLTIVAREIMPDDFLLVTPVSDTLPYVDDLSDLGAPEPDEAEPADAGDAPGEVLPLDGPDAESDAGTDDPLPGRSAKEGGGNTQTWADFVQTPSHAT